MNHYYDTDRAATRCGEYEGETAFHVSANGRVSCPDCLNTLTPDERAGQWYDRLDYDEPADTRNHTTRDQLAAVLAEHELAVSRYAHPGPGYFIECECGWREVTPSQPQRRHASHVSDALLASDAIAAVRAAAVAETTAAIEALAADWEQQVRDHERAAIQNADIERQWIADSYASRLAEIRAALSGGRTALDTMLNQARAELREQIARGIEDSRDRNQGNPAALAYLTHAAAIARHGRVEGADQ